MPNRKTCRLLALALLLTMAALSVACQGVGVGLGMSYPGRIYEPVGGGSWGGGPAYP